MDLQDNKNRRQSINTRKEQQFTNTDAPKQFARVAVCALNQWAMDFEQNKQNIIESIIIAKENNCTIRIGPELEITGYGCEDHFLESDTVQHSWEVVEEILKLGLTKNILVDLGMPVLHKNSLFNCRILLLNNKIILIRPKIFLADGGNYREPRWFTSWIGKQNEIEEFEIPFQLQKITGQQFAPIGNALIQTVDCCIGYEICEELWMPTPMNLSLCLDGCEIILNSSGSHFQISKQKYRIDLILEQVKKTGGIYLYSNCKGCDGGRLYFDGSNVIAQTGKICNINKMFTLTDVDVSISDVDLYAVRQYRAQNKSFGQQSTHGKAYPRVYADIVVGNMDISDSLYKELSEAELQSYNNQTEPEHWADSASCYLWDYLKRSGAAGFFLALSGGADSAASSLIIYRMCIILFETIHDQKNKRVLEQLRKVLRDSKYKPTSPQEICSKIFYTGYMGTENSSQETNERARRLSEFIGSTHYNLDISKVVSEFESIATNVFGQKPQYQAQGGTWMEDIALQNIQSRSRMVLAYLMGGLIPWNKKKDGFLLILTSANLDEGLRGYFTKYDCSSGDINPIGSFSKDDIKKFLKWIADKYSIEVVKEILGAPPTAELRPLDNSKKILQTDESDMGMTYSELKEFGILRKIENMGPVSMFQKLIRVWDKIGPQAVADKVKHFFKTYSINRHKMTTITPSYHAQPYSIDDNRFDQRQFLYNVNWPYQFQKIDQLTRSLIRKKSDQLISPQKFKKSIDQE